MEATGISAEILDALEARANAGEDVYEDCVSAGVEVTEDEEAQLWKHARLASIVDKRYGRKFVTEYAKAVKRSKRTIYERKQVFEFYPNSARCALLEDCALVYSHLRTAMRYGLKTCDDPADAYEAAMSFCAEIIENDWTIDGAEREARDRTGGGNTDLTLIMEASATAQGYALKIEDRGLVNGKTYIVKVYEEARIEPT